MTKRYPSTSIALPTSLAMVFTTSKSSLEAAGKPALIMSTSSLASCRAMSSFSLEVREAPRIACRRREWCRRCEHSWGQRCDWGCNWGGGEGKVWVWEWSLMGRNRKWETERQSGSEGERTIMRDRDERVRDKIYFLHLELHCSNIAKKFAIIGFTIP